MIPDLRDASALHPAAYNPREADPDRLELVHLSLRKLGWLLPIYAAGPEILSGHQRHLVAVERWGATRVPVVDLGGMGDRDRRLVNIAFNRGTNDLRVTDSSGNLRERVSGMDLHAMGEAFPDIDCDSADAFPCLRMKPRLVEELSKDCEGRWSDHAARLAYVLETKGITMPVIVAGDRVVNGVGRVQHAAREGLTTVQTVEIPADRAEFAAALLNLLTMDFALHTRYADLLRYSNARRGRSMEKLNLGMLYPMGLSTKEFDPKDPDQAKAWRRYFGGTVLDFGAGSMTDTRILRSMGIDVTPFEPWAYKLTRSEDLETVDSEASRAQVRAFLADVESGKTWDSVFMCSVLNSVPFDADRRHLVALIASLAGTAKVYPCAASASNGILRHVEDREFGSEFMARRLSFALEYEPRIVMTSFDGAAKTQRYFTPAEFFDLWAERFEKVRVIDKGGLVRAWVKDPKKVPKTILRDAIRFEFDLPMPDGTRLGLVDEAMKAWRSRGASI